MRPSATQCRRAVSAENCGKTTLISTLVSKAFPRDVPRTMHPVVVPPNITPENIRFTLVDTSCPSVRPSVACTAPPSLQLTNTGAAAAAHSDQQKMHNEVKQCDVVVLVASADQASSIDRVASFWIPLIRKLNHHVGSSLPHFPTEMTFESANTNALMNTTESP